ncbi:MAG: PspA/IM30 family protein [Coriobacteriales bacterium]|jgi:phage shock protein A
MAIFARITDVLKANINDLIDKAEDPEKMVKQIILEMEEQIDMATQGLGQAMASQKLAKKQLDQVNADIAEWDQKARAALSGGDEELARKALAAKVNLQDQQVKFESAYETVSAQVEQMTEQLKDLKIKLEEARSRKNMIIARSKLADASAVVAKGVSTTNVDSAFAKLDKMEEKVSEKESINEAYTEINGGEDADAYKELETKYAVDQELDSLKKEMGL